MFSAIPGSATTQYRLLQNTTEVENTSSQTTQILTTDAEQGEWFAHCEYLLVFLIWIYAIVGLHCL